jgi:hypothetical protein
VRRILRPRFLGNIALLIASTLVLLAGLEVLLRARPTVLGQSFANGALSKYTTRDGGIYYRDRNLRIHFMIPDLTTRMYANGYRWTHETDSLGFRNRGQVIPADVVILGDSYVYGHGLEYGQTVGHRLHELTKLTVANLGRQGDCIFQEAYLLTEYLPLFRPRWVVYVFFENDIPDLYAFLSDRQMEEFIASPLDAIRYPLRTDPTEALRAREASIRNLSLIQRARQQLYLYKAWRWLRWQLGVREAAAAPRRGPADPDDERSLAWRYTKHALEYMQFLTERAGAQLVVVALTPSNRRQHELLQGIARDAGLPLLDTSAFTAAQAALWLPGDGHLSPEGAHRLAALIAAYLNASPRGAPGVRHRAALRSPRGDLERED